MRRPEVIQIEFSLPVVILALIAVVSGCAGPETEYHLPVDARSFLETHGVSADASGYMKVTYTLSRYDRAVNRYVDITHETLIDPERSALVIVDVWNIDFLDSMIICFINPLIEEFDRLGAKIIYARSQHPQSNKLLISEGSITFAGSEIMDDYLFYHEIENLFYVGFDAFYCVTDKPNGIFSYRLRNPGHGARVFVFEQGVTSYTKEMKGAALSLLMKHDVGVIRSDSVTYSQIYPKRTSNDVFATTVCEVDTGNNFVLVFQSESVDTRLTAFEDFLKETSAEYGVIYRNRLTCKDRTIGDIYEFMLLLKRLEIKNIYYCGYHLNDEILWSEYGITPLYIKKRYSGLQELPEIYVINDLSYVIPSVSLDPDTEKAVVINYYRNVKDILSATLMIGLRRNHGVVPPFMDTLQDWRSWPFPAVLCPEPY